ncbi:DUF7240 domain-containing protein [Mycolicibacterium vanbaalenii]|uniref:DUF7240 domain-containing protein n=1 Tax=Mycolicibacterium vanbaalenii TaxID=110539 RepID=UPI00132FA107|nr:hypothetical protein [Mycolicibacterium vanbaalenii]
MTTAHHWRDVRQFIRENGIADPLTALPSMHDLLDYTEKMVLQGITSGADRAAGEMERKAYLARLYGPQPGERPALAVLDPDGDDAASAGAVPAGFEDRREVEASFDAFAAAMR